MSSSELLNMEVEAYEIANR